METENHEFAASVNNEASPTAQWSPKRKYDIRPRNTAEQTVVVEPYEEYLRYLNVAECKPIGSLCIDHGKIGLRDQFNASINLTAWEIITLAQYWTDICRGYLGMTLQSSDRWDLDVLLISMGRLRKMERVLAWQINRMCKTIAKECNRCRRCDGVKSLAHLLEEMGWVWNLAPVMGWQWNEFGMVPKFRLARAVRRAANLIGWTESQKKRCTKARVRWRSGRGLDFYDDHWQDQFTAARQTKHHVDTPVETVGDCWEKQACRTVPELTNKTLVGNYCEKPGDREVLLWDPCGEPVLWIAMNRYGNTHLYDYRNPEMVDRGPEDDDSGELLLPMIVKWMLDVGWNSNGRDWLFEMSRPERILELEDMDCAGCPTRDETSEN